MQILGEVVALHWMPGIVGAQAEACACTTICLLQTLLPAPGSCNQNSPASSSALKPSAKTPLRTSPAISHLVLADITPPRSAHVDAADNAQSMITPSSRISPTGQKGDRVRDGRGASPAGKGCEGKSGGVGVMQPSVLRDCSRQLASLLQWSSLHMQRNVDASPSSELAQVTDAQISPRLWHLLGPHSFVICTACSLFVQYFQPACAARHGCESVQRACSGD